ncbi:amidohydrolase [Cupriavidus sp. GA3-3]|nr:amidohydrolase [Cupriavidus sp. GA3-3]
MHLRPVAGDIDTAADPHLVVSLHIVEKALQRAEAARAAEQAAVHADRQHLGAVLAARVAFLIQDVERILQVLEELFAGIEALRRGKAHVVGVERVRHHQVRLLLAAGDFHLGPEGQVVAVVVRVVQEAAVLHHQAARVGAVAAGVPAQRQFAGQVLDDLHADAHVLALGGFVEALVVDPAPAVAGDLVAQFDKSAGQFRMALQRHRHAEDGQRQAALLELAQQAPDAGARAVFVDALHAHVAVGVGRGADDLGEELLGGGVAVQHAVFAAFFVVEDELQRNARTARPAGVRRPGAVTDEIAWIAGLEHGGGVGIGSGSHTVQFNA